MGVVVLTGALLNAPVQAAAPTKWGRLTITQGPTAVTLAVEIADTPLSRERGLGLRESLPETQGMLFVFDTIGFSELWNGGTLIPLSIAFLDYDPGTQQWKIMQIVDMDPAPDPHRNPVRGYHAAKPYRYALEVNQGFFQRHNLTVGARVQGTSGVALIPPVQTVVTGKQGTLSITQGPTTVALAVEIADTPTSRVQGLALRESLPETSGMLFVWDTIGLDTANLGNRDYLIPTSLAFIEYDTGTQQWEISQIVDMDVAPDPHHGPFQALPPAAKPFRYALEVNQGFFQRHNLTIGARVQGTSGAALLPSGPTVTNKRGTLLITQGPTTVTLEVEIADTPLSRAQGLGLRESLPETSGMWFDFETLDFQQFWMTDVLIPLSVAFIADRAGPYSHRPQWEIAEIVDMDVAPDPHHGPFQTYHAAKPFRYALEVNQGFFQRHGLTVGAKVQLTPP